MRAAVGRLQLAPAGVLGGPVRTVCGLIAVCAGADGAEPAAPTGPLENVTVVATPLGAEVLPVATADGSVRRYTAEALESEPGSTLADVLGRRQGNAFASETQGSAWQPDLYLRGFVASPMLGMPQGLAVYRDGIRLNDAFGDTVNWALIPTVAVAEMQVLTGASPLFGGNALGGAALLRTKNGRDHAGVQAQLQLGEFGNVGVQAQAGGALAARGYWYVAGASQREEGWRDFSPSRIDQVFTDLRLDTARGFMALDVTAVEADLIGNGPAPVQLLDLHPSAVFTRPDRSDHRQWLVSVRSDHRLGSASLRSAVWFRDASVDSINGDESPYLPCASDTTVLCSEDGGVVVDRLGQSAPNRVELSSATLNRGQIDQQTTGISLEWSKRHESGGLRWGRGVFTTGLTADRSRITYRASSELGALNSTRKAVGGGFIDVDADTELRTTAENIGLYLNWFQQWSPRWSTQLAARYGHSTVKLADQLRSELDGDHAFSRLNASLSLTGRLTDAVSMYASIGQASRVPTPAELTCADPEDPCRLPNAFVADPHLDQVVSTTVEAGVRGEQQGWRWRFGVFESRNVDDILFISAGAFTNAGYFDNVGDTRRRGIEASLDGATLEGRLNWFVDAALLDATFRTGFAVASGNNPAAVDGNIEVSAGHRLPSLPAFSLKAGVEHAISERWSVGADYSRVSSQYLRGDEGNQTHPIPGSDRLALHTRYRFNPRWELFARIDNVTDERYATFGAYGNPTNVLGGDFDDPRFLSPGAPRTAWIGVRFSDRPSSP